MTTTRTTIATSCDGDTADLSAEGLQASGGDSSAWRLTRPRRLLPWPVRLIGYLLDGLAALVVWFGEWADGETPEQIERHGG